MLRMFMVVRFKLIPFECMQIEVPRSQQGFKDLVLQSSLCKLQPRVSMVELLKFLHISLPYV